MTGFILFSRVGVERHNNKTFFSENNNIVLFMSITIRTTTFFFYSSIQPRGLYQTMGGEPCPRWAGLIRGGGNNFSN